MADEAGAGRGAAGEDTPVRVFISYSWDSDAHKNRVLSLVDRLRADGITCLFDQDAPYRPEGWPQWCLNCIEEADFVLLVCTENYYKRFRGKEKSGVGNGVKYEGYVINQALFDDGMLNSKYFPILFGAVDVAHIPEPLRGTTRYILTDESDYWNLYALLTDQHPTPEHPQGTRKILPRAVRQPLFGTATQSASSSPWSVPHSSNPFFTGRRDELDALHAALQGGGRAAICQAISGLGGIGKTQTAVRYCYDQRDAYAAVFWLRAQSPDTLTADVQAVARELGLPEAGAGDQSATIRAVQRWLCDNTGWLLVLDNVDTDEMAAVCRDFLPTGLQGGAVLITSRLDDLTELNVARPLRLPVLPEAEAVAFLLQRTAREEQGQAETDAALRLARELGCLPLALEQAAAYCKANRLTFDQYWERFEKAGLALLAKGRVKAGSYEKTIATTWALSIAEVARECPAAVAVLQVCSMLAAEAIPLEVIRKGGAEMGPAVVAVLEDGIEAALAPLAKYSLIDWEAGAEDFSMHRLVQCATREAMAEEEKKERAEQAVAAVNIAFPNVEFEVWALCERLVPHSYACLQWMEMYTIQTQPAARLCNQADYYLSDQGRYAEAEVFSRRAIDIKEKILEPNNPSVAISLNNLAGLFQCQGKLAEADPLYRRALEIRERVLGPDHPDVANSLNNLALLLRDQGKLAEAEPLYHRALEIRERVLGPDHPDVANSLNSLALLLCGQGKLAEAEVLSRRALDIWEGVLGPDHPSVATSLNNLAGLLEGQGKLAEAEPLYRRALEIRERVLGPGHPDVANSLNNLAGLLEGQGKLAEAELLFHRALEIRERVLGPDHPDVATSLNNLAGLLRGQGKLAEAEVLSRRALGIWEEVLGPDHPNVAISLENLAILLLRTNRADEAAPLYARAKAIRKAHAQRNNLP